MAPGVRVMLIGARCVLTARVCLLGWGCQAGAVAVGASW